MSAGGRRDLPLLDGLRLLASFAIVHHHMRGEFFLGLGFGLPLFLVIMFGLAASSTKGEAVGAFARRKARYLLVPWLRWSLLYLTLLALVGTLRGSGPLERFEPAMLVYGGHRSLWFLPFAAVALVPVKALCGPAERTSPRCAAWVFVAAAALATAAVAWLRALPLPDMPARAWLRVSPALFWGLAVGQSARLEGERDRASLLTGIAVAALVGGWLLPSGELHEDAAGRFAVAVPLACLGFGVRVRVPAAVRALAGTTFGIYLFHPLVAKGLVEGFDVFAWPAALHAAVTWTLACAGVLALRRAGLGWHELSTRRGPARRRPDAAEPGSAGARRAA